MIINPDYNKYHLPLYGSENGNDHQQIKNSAKLNQSLGITMKNFNNDLHFPPIDRNHCSNHTPGVGSTINNEFKELLALRESKKKALQRNIQNINKASK